MRRLVVVLIVAAFAVSLAGCGGGGAATTTTPPAPAPAAAAPPPGLPLTITNRSANETITFAPFPITSTTPTAVKDVIAAKQPSMIFFYDSQDNVSQQAQDVIDDVREENRGLVDLISYDIGKWVTVSKAGTMTIDPAFATDAEARRSITLARSLGASTIPFVVLTDSQGYIIWKRHGALDRAMLEREVQRAAK